MFSNISLAKAKHIKLKGKELLKGDGNKYQQNKYLTHGYGKSCVSVWATGCPESCETLFLGVSVKVFREEICGGRSNNNSPPQCGQASSICPGLSYTTGLLGFSSVQAADCGTSQRPLSCEPMTLSTYLPTCHLSSIICFLLALFPWRTRIHLKQWINWAI